MGISRTEEAVRERRNRRKGGNQKRRKYTYKLKN